MLPAANRYAEEMALLAGKAGGGRQRRAHHRMPGPHLHGGRRRAHGRRVPGRAKTRPGAVRGESGDYWKLTRAVADIGCRLMRGASPGPWCWRR